MKKIIVSILMLTAISIGVNAQTLQERLAAKLLKKTGIQKKLEDRAAANAMSLDSSVSQDEAAVSWEDGTYEGYSFNGSSCLQTADLNKKIKFTKKGGKVVSVSIDGSAPYVADQLGKSKFVRYFKSEGSLNMVFGKGWAYSFVGDGDKRGLKGVAFYIKRGRYADAEMVKRYLIAAKVNQKAELAAIAKNESAAADKVAAEKEAKWSIKGKKVTKIEVTDIKAPYSFGYYRSFSFQVKATLANGKTISTKDGGFWSDYTFSYQNGDVKSKTIQDTKFVKGDKIVVTVKSKFDSKIVSTGDVVMDYSETLTTNFNSNNWGTSGSSLKIEVKQRKHAVTGKAIIMIKVTDLSGYAKPKYMIIDADQSLNVWTKGHNGYKTVGTGNATGPGANAGNGGNITVYKDPSVTSFNIEYTMDGGTGGAGTYGYNRGRDGRDGKYKEIVRAVNF
jgi:hypothetical protein